jgi:cytochrome c peroxidase
VTRRDAGFTREIEEMPFITASRSRLAVMACAAVLAASVYVRTVSAASGPSADYVRYFSAYARPAAPPFPATNAFSPEREQLGKALFFDPRLSGSGWISCASCHNPALSWGDGLPRAIGHGMQTLGRRTPTILNLAWADSLFWDGRAASLEEQALGPIQAAGEMNLPLDEMVRRIAHIAGYRERFERAYPGEGITPATVGKSIATFERTVISGTAAFDRWIAGDENAIPEDARRGFVVFNDQGRCAQCHSGWRFTDDSFHDIGVVTSDIGRGAILKDIPPMQSAFKTPTLRNIAGRGPYMHNGSLSTLEEVVELYDRGGLVQRPSLSPEARPLHLSAQQKSDLVAFLKTLTGDDRPVAIPVLPR